MGCCHLNKTYSNAKLGQGISGCRALRAEGLACAKALGYSEKPLRLKRSLVVEVGWGE
jgi:hypothetical protein